MVISSERTCVTPFDESSYTASTLSGNDMESAKSRPKARAQRWNGFSKGQMVVQGYGHTPILLSVLLYSSIFVFSTVYFFNKLATHHNNPAVRLSHAASKASGFLLHLNMAFIFFPVCQNVMQLLRRTLFARMLNVDARVVIHKHMAWSMVSFTGVHIVAQGALSAQNTLVDNPGPRNFLRPNSMNHQGWSGLVMLTILLAMAVTSLDRARKRSYLMFWTFHCFHGLFYVLWIVHESSVLRVNEGPRWVRDDVAFKYGMCGILVWLIEISLRAGRSHKHMSVMKVIQHPSEVLEIQIEKEDLLPKIGQVSL